MRTHESLSLAEKQQLEAALRQCAGEPIHRPGLIQPHGVLLALAASDLSVCYASQNLSNLFAVESEAALGLPFAHQVGEHQAERLRNLNGAAGRDRLCSLAHRHVTPTKRISQALSQEQQHPSNPVGNSSEGLGHPCFHSFHKEFAS